MKSALKKDLHDALDAAWELVAKELRREIEIRLQDTNPVVIELHWPHVDRPTIIRLSKLVGGLIERRPGTSAMLEEAAWAEHSAADFERQATRLRAHARKLRRKKPEQSTP